MKKKLLAILLAAVMMLSLVPVMAIAAEDGDAKNQIAKNGGWTFWDKIGGQVAVENTATNPPDEAWVAVSKTIEDSELNPALNLDENEFVITLEVRTKMDLKEVEISQDAAVVLVLDRSASMFMIPGVEATDSSNQNAINGTSTSYPTEGNDYTDSRMYALKDALKTFIEAYRDPDGAARWISVVYFDSQATAQPMPSNYWVDVSTEDGLKAFYTLIYGNVNGVINATGGLQPQSTSDPNRGYTNIEAGLAVARNLYIYDGLGIGSSRVLPDYSSVYTRSVILFTDGVPTYYGSANDSYNGTGLSFTLGSSAMGNTYYDTHVARAKTRVNEIQRGAANRVNANVFAIGYADSEGAGILDQIDAKTWSGDSLEEIFKSINDTITSLSQAWIVTDPMGDNIVFDTLYDYQGLSYDADQLKWELMGRTGIPLDDEWYGWFKHTASYKVTLDTIAAKDIDEAFKSGTGVPANGETTLTYLIVVDGTPQSTEYQTAYFTVPDVFGYKADLEFIKTAGDDTDALLEGATFKLWAGDEDDPDFELPATSGSDGIILFEGLPSGHEYYLKETTAPEGFDLDETVYVVTVSYGEISIADEGGEDGNFYYENDLRYFANSTNYKPPQGSLSVMKTVDGEEFNVWLDGYTAAEQDAILNGIIFNLYSAIYEDGEYKLGEIVKSVIAVDGIGLSGEIGFGVTLAGYYAIVEEFSGLAADVFEPIPPYYFYYDGTNATVTDIGSDFDYEAFYTIVNGYNLPGSRILNYPGLNNNGDLFYIGITNTETGKEYVSFCANSGSTNFAGEGGVGCSGYYVGKPIDKLDSAMPLADYLSALNYIEDKYGDVNKYRAITQTVIWALLGAIDVNSAAFDATNLTNAEKDAVRDVIAKYAGYTGNGKIVNAVFLVCDKHAEGHNYSKCQPQIVPIYGGGFDNKATETKNPQGSASFLKVAIGDDDADVSEFTFKLYKYNDETGEYDIQIGDVYHPDLSGAVNSGDLDIGLYKFVEVDLPEGWMIAEAFEDGIFFKILEEGTLVKTYWLIDGDYVLGGGGELGAIGPDVDNIKLGSLDVTVDVTAQHEKTTYQPYFYNEYQPYFVNEIQPYYHNVYERYYKSGGNDTLVTRLTYNGIDAKAVPTNGGTFKNGHTYVAVDVAAASAAGGVWYEIADSSMNSNGKKTPSEYNRPIGYQYNVQIVNGELIVSFPDNLKSASVGAYVVGSLKDPKNGKVDPDKAFPGNAPKHYPNSVAVDMPAVVDNGLVYLYFHLDGGITWWDTTDDYTLVKTEECAHKDITQIDCDCAPSERQVPCDCDPDVVKTETVYDDFDGTLEVVVTGMGYNSGRVDITATGTWSKNDLAPGEYTITLYVDGEQYGAPVTRTVAAGGSATVGFDVTVTVADCTDPEHQDVTLPAMQCDECDDVTLPAIHCDECEDVTLPAIHCENDDVYRDVKR